MPGSGLCDSDQIALWNLGPSCVGLHYGPHVFVEMFLVDFRFFYWPLRGCTGDLGKSRPLKTIPQRN